MSTATKLHGVVDMPAEEYRSISVGSGQVAIVNAADYNRLACYNWRVLDGHNGKKYAYAKYAGGAIYMHRMVAQTALGYETDHINGDGLDNRRANLRIATASQNRANAGKPRLSGGRSSTSIYKGVSWVASRGKWLAGIQCNGRTRNLGRYATEIEAARAYDRAAIAAWGEFAKVNFPDEVTAK